jgi:hypothetical protein
LHLHTWLNKLSTRGTSRRTAASQGIYIMKKLAITPVLLCVLVAGCASGGSAEGVRSPAAEQPSVQPEPTGPAEDVFYSEAAGFGLVKPAGWLFAPVEWDEVNRQRVSIGNAELDELVRKHASAPLLIVLKHPEPYDKINPSIKVTLRPLGQLQGMMPRAIAEVVVAGMKQSIPSLELQGDIEETSVGGLAAAHLRSRVTITAGEPAQDFLVLSRMWFVPRGGYLFLVGMSGPVTGDEVSEQEFAKVLRTIQIRE